MTPCTRASVSRIRWRSGEQLSSTHLAIAAKRELVGKNTQTLRTNFSTFLIIS